MILVTIIVSIADYLLRICLLCLAMLVYQLAAERLRLLLRDNYYALVKSIKQNPSYQLAVERLQNQFYALIKRTKQNPSSSTDSFTTQYDKGTKTADALRTEMPGTFTTFGPVLLNATTLAAHEEETKQILEEAMNRPLPIGA